MQILGKSREKHIYYSVGSGQTKITEIGNFAENWFYGNKYQTPL